MIALRLQLDKEFFSCPPDMATVFHAGKIDVNCEANSFSIKSLSTFKEELLAPEIDDVFRFLVDTAGQLWFANETRPHNQAPKHFQMTGAPIESAVCLTAGNIKFKKNGAVLKNISHCSGDFRPSFFSLRWLLAILVVNEELLLFKLPKLIVIKEIKDEKIYKHIWRVKRVKKWVDSFSHNEILINQLRQQNLGSKLVHYEATKHDATTRIPEMC